MFAIYYGRAQVIITSAFCFFKVLNSRLLHASYHKAVKDIFLKICLLKIYLVFVIAYDAF